MRLTRNTTSDGRCKYALVRLDKIRAAQEQDPTVQAALKLLENRGLLEYGEKGSEEEAFTIKLKDRFAADALQAYASKVRQSTSTEEWREYADEIDEIAVRSLRHPKRKLPTP